MKKIINSFNAARSILCGATNKDAALRLMHKFQCRTQHFMWCNKYRLKRRKSFFEVSMPHAAFYVVQQ